MESSIYLWIGFNVFVLLMLALDLGVFHRNAHEVKFREAITWSAVWIMLALTFNAGLWYYFGEVKAIEFLTGYIVEKSLSVDNIFVFVLEL
jgi:tellurite resistance protein TerC